MEKPSTEVGWAAVAIQLLKAVSSSREPHAEALERAAELCGRMARGELVERATGSHQNRLVPMSSHCDAPRDPARTNPTLGEQLTARAEQAVREALATARGNRTHAAEVLGVTRRALLYHMSRMGLQDYSRGGFAEGRYTRTRVVGVKTSSDPELDARVQKRWGKDRGADAELYAKEAAQHTAQERFGDPEDL